MPFCYELFVAVFFFCDGDGDGAMMVVMMVVAVKVVVEVLRLKWQSAEF